MVTTNTKNYEKGILSKWCVHSSSQ